LPPLGAWALDEEGKGGNFSSLCRPSPRRPGASNLISGEN
jgi:hypothetical protein